METFETIPGFCPDCGTILPMLKPSGRINCYICSREFDTKVFGDMEENYTIYFNSRESCAKNAQEKKKQKAHENDDEGPIVDRKCPKCGNEKMSYATLQLRSADEGQTVFFTCTECKFKEAENS